MQLLHRHPRCRRVPGCRGVVPQRGRQGVRCLKDPTVIAPCRGQGQDRDGGQRVRAPVDRLATSGIEGTVELIQRRGAGTTPSVDRLVGVADGGHAAIGEETGQEPDLRRRGVLELVEQNATVLLAQRRNDLL